MTARLHKRFSRSDCNIALAAACVLTLSACASPLAPVAKPDNFYGVVGGDVEDFWTGVFSSELKRTYTPLSKMEFFVESVNTPCGPAGGPGYCPTNRTVYLESGFMQTQLSAFGDFAPAMIIAHEIGHHIQGLLGLLGPERPKRDKELEADCLAGAWVGSAGSRDLLQGGDYQEAADGVFSIGDPYWSGPDHGTPQQRLDSFRTGFAFGVGGC